MDIEIARLANQPWFQIPDRQVFAMRAGFPCWKASRARPGNVAERVPMLAWPPTLFEDEDLCQ